MKQTTLSRCRAEVSLCTRALSLGDGSSLIDQIRMSRLSQDAISLVILNAISKAFAFLGTAHAASCLGPVNLGVSALVQATSQQVALAYNGGFDNVAVRRIARAREEAQSTTAAIVVFRLCAAFALCGAWVVIVPILVPVPQRLAWRLGSLLLLSAGANVGFAFQGLERLPVQNAISAGGSALTAAAYLLLFHPGVGMGADLAVFMVTSLVTTATSWIAFRRVVGAWPISKAKWSALSNLFAESWRYWVLAVVVYLYSAFQITLVAYFAGVNQAGLFRSAFVLAAGLELFFNSANSLLLARLVAWNTVSPIMMWHRQKGLVALWCALGIPMVLALFVAAPFVYRIFLGPQFAGAADVFRLLIIGRLIVFVGQIYAWGLTAVARDNEFMLISCLGAVCSLSLNWVLLPRMGIMACGIASVTSEAVVVSSCFLVLRRHVRGSATGLLAPRCI
jgi:O-antigen/teichoic acid export membrane protein